MPRVGLIHSNDEFSELLARSATERSKYTVDNYSVVRPPRRRAAGVLLNHFEPLTEGYDLLQVDELLLNGPMGVTLARLLDIPIVAYFRGWADHTNAHGSLNRWTALRRRLQTRLLLRSVDRVVCISAATHDELSVWFDLPDPTVVHRPVDIDYYAGGTDPFESDTTRLLTVTNLGYEAKFEGVTVVLEALKDVFPAHPDIEYLIAGGGEYEEALRSYVDDYEFGDRVEVLGFRSDVADVLAGANVFVYVSFLDGLSTTVLEAQAAGLPVVAGDSVGVPEVVGDAGLVVDPTADGIAAGLKAVFGEKTRRSELATASDQKMEVFNETVTDAFIDVWDSVLGQ